MNEEIKYTDEDIFKEIMDAVEEYNEFNERSWSDWEDSLNIFDTYEVRLNARVAKLLDLVIATNNQNDVAYAILKKLEKEVWGKIFSDSTDRFMSWNEKPVDSFQFLNEF